MIEMLTGAFSGVVCALFAAAFGCAVSKGKRFDFWILIVGPFVGLFAALLGASYFTWQEWFLTVVILVLFEYAGKAIYVRGSPLIRRVDKDNVLMWAFIVGSVVFVEWWIIAFFMWFYPMVGSRFAFYELNADGEMVWQWFAINMPQIERATIVAYLIFGAPAVCVIVGSPFAFTISNFVRKRKRLK